LRGQQAGSCGIGIEAVGESLAAEQSLDVRREPRRPPVEPGPKQILERRVPKQGLPRSAGVVGAEFRDQADDTVYVVLAVAISAVGVGRRNRTARIDARV